MLCPHCRGEIELGEMVSICQACGQVQHEKCFQNWDTCGSYHCAPQRRVELAAQPSDIKITSGDLKRVHPAKSVFHPRRPHANSASAAGVSSDRPGMNRLAVIALVIALLGIPLFGLITGLMAIALGCIALATHKPNARGAGFAVSGILLGVVDMAGWVVFLALFLNGRAENHQVIEFEPDAAEIEAAAPHIRRAIKANVLIESHNGIPGFSGGSIGSGVILRIQDGEALIVTNRHVIDDEYTGDEFHDTKLPTDIGELRIKLIGQLSQPGKLVWMAPDGIDLALLTVPVLSPDVLPAVWDAAVPQLAVGDEVFAIGNPHGLGWTHTSGGISQFRSLASGNRKIRVIQISTAINSGNSGGGLYDQAGKLIGINTWSDDKRFSEGLSFTIAFESLLELAPHPLEGFIPPQIEASDAL
ncbi:Periplasmic serine endoprotease DegP precursor [Symmachiella macrocystis]|uniref:Periplasmic serine endoprotease DegP n=1 Tax=Symmachiella macrocystis TaxID=2527985 RepID=A0A5C6AYU6_9PLAN|nr:Periplasmic serine endoprotease DegP precursor [Symmachiella macrocystis]